MARKRMHRRSASRFVALGILAVAIIFGAASALHAARESRPFWTEKSSFIEGDELFVVGIASRARSVEDGRKQAFENGKIELMNFAQVTSLEARGLVIETQMTYEESNPDGSVTVYRLLKIPGKKLLEIQDRVHAEGRVQEIAIEKQIQELSDIQRKLETKTSKVEQRQREVDSLLKNIEMRFPTSGGPGNQASKADSLTSRMKSIETVLIAEERELSEISRRATARIFDEKERDVKRCKLLVLGMIPEEVRAIMGEPIQTKIYETYERNGKQEFQGYYYYGSPVNIDLQFWAGRLIGIVHKTSKSYSTAGCRTIGENAP